MTNASRKNRTSGNIPQRPALATANSDADEALRRVQGKPAPIRPPAQRQARHALTALTTTSPGRRQLIAACAEDYLAQIDRRVLPVGWTQPITNDHYNRADAYRLRSGDQFARMLGIACQPSDPHLPDTARTVLAAINSPVTELTNAATVTGDPVGIAVLYVITGTVPSQVSQSAAVAA